MSCVEASLVLLEESVCYDKCILLVKLLSCNGGQFRYHKSEYVRSVALRKHPVLHVLTTDLPFLAHTTIKVFAPLHLFSCNFNCSTSIPFLKDTIEAGMKKKQDSFKLMLSFLNPT